MLFWACPEDGDSMPWLSHQNVGAVSCVHKFLYLTCESYFPRMKQVAHPKFTFMLVSIIMVGTDIASRKVAV